VLRNLDLAGRERTAVASAPMEMSPMSHQGKRMDVSIVHEDVRRQRPRTRDRKRPLHARNAISSVADERVTDGHARPNA
jgi:hypothetical protein